MTARLAAALVLVLAGPMPARAADPAGTDQPPGSADAPAVAHDRAADRYWDAAAMAAAERAEMQPPVPLYSRLLVDRLEQRMHDGRDGYGWEGEFWLGDVDRLVIRSKGEGSHGGAVDEAEVQAVYARALDPWWNLQAGVRQDLPGRSPRTWATVGIEGRAPYQFEVQAAAYLSDRGQLAGRIEGAYDQRITQRLVLQPRAELELSAQDMPERRIGAGLSTAELELRLRYELRREFAPYIGMSWSWRTGRTARYARRDGEDRTERSVVAGIRFWL